MHFYFAAGNYLITIIRRPEMLWRGRETVQFCVLRIGLLTASSYGLIHYTGNLLFWSRNTRNVRTGNEFYFYICTAKHLISQGWNLNKYGKN